MKKLTTIVLTGPESTGKSSLASQLAEHFNINYVPEFARFYLESNGGDYLVEDFESMLQGQLSWEKDKLESTENAIILLDTDILTYKIWWEFKYGTIREDIDKLIADASSRFYLLCEPDLDWEEDPLRENPRERWEIFARYVEALNFFNLKYSRISGKGEARLTRAKKKIQELMS